MFGRFYSHLFYSMGENSEKTNGSIILMAFQRIMNRGNDDYYLRAHSNHTNTQIERTRVEITKTNIERYFD